MRRTVVVCQQSRTDRQAGKVWCVIRAVIKLTCLSLLLVLCDVANSISSDTTARRHSVRAQMRSDALCQSVCLSLCVCVCVCVCACVCAVRTMSVVTPMHCQQPGRASGLSGRDDTRRDLLQSIHASIVSLRRRRRRRQLIDCYNHH